MAEDELLRYELDPGESLCEGVLMAVAAASESDPTDLPPLYEAIDPDALSSLFAPIRKKPTGDGLVRFPYNGFEVVIHSYGMIQIHSPGDEQEADPG